MLSPVILRQPGYLQTIAPAIEEMERVNHSGILRCLGLRQAEDYQIVLFEDADNYEPLSYALARGKTFDASQAMAILRQLVTIADYAIQRAYYTAGCVQIVS